MDFKTIQDKTMAAISNPRILTFTLIGTTTMLIGAFLFFGDDVEPVKDTTEASVAAAVAPLSFMNQSDETEVLQEPEQTGGGNKRRKKTRSFKKRLVRKSKRI